MVVVVFVVVVDDDDDEVLLYVHGNPSGLLGTGGQDVHLDFHTEL